MLPLTDAVAALVFLALAAWLVRQDEGRVTPRPFDPRKIAIRRPERVTAGARGELDAGVVADVEAVLTAKGW